MAGWGDAYLAENKLAHVSPHPTTKQSHVKFTRDFVDSCRPSLSRAPNPHPSLQTRVGGVSFLVVGAPPLCTLSTATPSLAPKRESEGFPLVFPAPSNASLHRAPRPASTPLACVPRQCPRPVRHVNAPSLRAVSTPLRCVDAPSLRAASTPPPLPLHSLPLH